jgi:ribokinase
MAITASPSRPAPAPARVRVTPTHAAFAHARKGGAITLLNPAPAQPLTDELLALCDLLTPNETELRLLAGMPPGTPTAEAAEALLARGAGAVAVTLGAAGCALFRPGRPALAVAGHAVQVADTIGAGDTFTGAMAAGLARGEPIAAALAWANAAAALSVGGRGAIAGMPGPDAVRALLASR